MRDASAIAWVELLSPMGRLRLFATDASVVALLWERDTERPGRVPVLEGARRIRSASERPLLERAAAELAEYFEGRRRVFDLQLEPRGTAFQRLVWDELIRVPYGETVSYGEVAARIGRPRAARAVGAAVGRNPIAVIVPCHRIVGADGALTGFAGGLEAKRRLLELEERSGLASVRSR